MTGPHPTNGLHGVLADSYPMPGPEPGAFEGMPMPQELPVMSMTMTMPMPMPSAPAEPQNALEADNTLTALLVDPTLNQPIQVLNPSQVSLQRRQPALQSNARVTNCGYQYSR